MSILLTGTVSPCVPYRSVEAAGSEAASDAGVPSDQDLFCPAVIGQGVLGGVRRGLEKHTEKHTIHKTHPPSDNMHYNTQHMT